MYAVGVSMQLNANAGAEFTRTIEKDVLPLLRRQTGFVGELTFLSSNGKDAVAISLWEGKASADVYGRDSHPQVLKDLANVVVGTPEAQVYEVSNSTFHKIGSLLTTSADHCLDGGADLAPLLFSVAHAN